MYTSTHSNNWFNFRFKAMKIIIKNMFSLTKSETALIIFIYFQIFKIVRTVLYLPNLCSNLIQIPRNNLKCWSWYFKFYLSISTSFRQYFKKLKLEKCFFFIKLKTDLACGSICAVHLWSLSSLSMTKHSLKIVKCTSVQPLEHKRFL